MNGPTTIDEHERPVRDIVPLALVVESGLAVVAVGVGWLISHDPFSSIDVRVLDAVLWGLLATLPMLAGLILIEWIPFQPLVKLNDVVDRLLVPLFARASILQMLLISLAAGIGEEALFRGLIQGALAEQLDSPYRIAIGLVAASVAFGVCHWITKTYAVLATLIGLYLGWLYILTGNLLAAIIAHALYDFVALVYLVRWKQRRQGSQPH